MSVSLLEEAANEVCREISAREIEWGPFDWRELTFRIEYYNILHHHFQNYPFRQETIQRRVLEFLENKQIELVEKLMGQPLKRRIQKAIEQVESLDG